MPADPLRRHQDDRGVAVPDLGVRPGAGPGKEAEGGVALASWRRWPGAIPAGTAIRQGSSREGWARARPRARGWAITAPARTTCCRPTGTARCSSPLGVYDFRNCSSPIEVSEVGANVLGPIRGRAGVWGVAAGPRAGVRNAPVPRKRPGQPARRDQARTISRLCGTFCRKLRRALGSLMRSARFSNSACALASTSAALGSPAAVRTW